MFMFVMFQIQRPSEGVLYSMYSSYKDLFQTAVFCKLLLMVVVLAMMRLLLMLSSSLSQHLLVFCVFFFNCDSFSDTERKQHLTHLNRTLNKGQGARCLKMSCWTQ